MKIYLHTLMAGPTGVRHPGEHNVPDDQGRVLVLSGHATRLDGPIPSARPPMPPVETADAQPPEDATKGPKGGKRK